LEASAQTTLYSIGAPSAEEQLSLELINRARMNPGAEGVLLQAQAQSEVSILAEIDDIGTNLGQMVTEMGNLAIPKQPLSFNENLNSIALIHNQNMLASDEQTHFPENNGKYFKNRMDANGYIWSAAAENIFAYSFNVSEAHAAFEIDWGEGDPDGHGMQFGRTHRETIHSDLYREVGISFMQGSGDIVGPWLITQDFGERISRSDTKPLITGVAIYDADGDGFYDIGEGIEGVTVKVVRTATGAVETHYAETTGSGGYSVRVLGGAGAYRVEFSHPDFVTQTANVILTSEQVDIGGGRTWTRVFNEKVDLILPQGASPGYVPPVVAGSNQILEGVTHTVDFPDLPAVEEYEVLTAVSVASPAMQDAVSSAPIISDLDIYSILQTPSGMSQPAFHLAHGNNASDQAMLLDRVFVPGAGASVEFDSRLRLASSPQFALLQVTSDWEKSWNDVWFQQGNGSAPNGYTPISVDLSEFAGQPIKFRFVYYLGAGTYTPDTSSSAGWHFDNIEFAGMTELTNITEVTTEKVSHYDFTPPAAGDYHVQVRARAGTDFLPYADPIVYQVTGNDFAGWAARAESASGLAAGTLASMTGDFDGDGLNQLMEYGLEASGFDPAVADSDLLPVAEVEGEFLCLHYTVDMSRDDVSVSVEVSTDLVNWFAPGAVGVPAGFVDNAIGAPVGALQARTAKIPLGNHESVYLRFRVNEAL